MAHPQRICQDRAIIVGMRILIQEGKDPFTPVAAESIVVQNVVNRNLGNMLFGHSVHRTLAVDGSELVASGTLNEFHEATAEDHARVNDEFDMFVVPVANYLRAGNSRRLNNLASLIEGLTIPVVVVGIGAQAPADGLRATVSAPAPH